MAEDLTPGQVRARQFDVVRKGYERGQVDSFLSDVATQLTSLEARIAESADRDVALGIEDQEALARELHAIGGDVAAIIESARAAAEGMRTRASGDAASWRDSAQTESTQLLDEASEQSQSMRASAWNEGSSLLKSAAAESESLIAGAKEDALFVRAEAEREALRLTGDAKRDREEMIRAARMEADQIVDSARTESDGVLAAAAQQADLAQERARALEDRRSELLAELEATRASIGELETEIESRRQELEAPDPEPEPVVDQRTHHASDGGSVRIVSSTNVVALEPVDADSLVAEVEALRSGEADPDPAPSIEPALPTPAAPDPVVAEAEVEATGELDAVIVEEAVVLQPEPEPEPEPDAEPEPAAAAPAVTEAPVVTPVPEEQPSDDLGSLFAQLREPAAATEAVDEPEPEPAPVPQVAEPAPPTDNEKPTTHDGKQTPDDRRQTTEAASEPAQETTSESTDAATVIPLQNAALRSIKRSLVELQNETLEHLRTDNDWTPDEAFTDRFGDAFNQLTESLTGAADPDVGAAFGTDLYDAVSTAIAHAREAGAGDREVASAASKVFRTWRSDEAERRVVAVTEESSVGA